MDLRGMTALVTGASSGIGRATALALAKAHVRVALSGRRVDALEAVAAEIAAADGVAPVVLPADLAERGAATVLGARALAALEHVDLLVNNAATLVLGSQWEMVDEEPARALFETNYWAPLALVRTLLPGMLARRWGAVVNVSSLAAFNPTPGTGPYPSSKAALNLATEALRLELPGRGVHVMLVLLGLHDTAMLRAYQAKRSTGRIPITSPERAAARIVTGLRRERKMVVSPPWLAYVPQIPILSSWFSSFFELQEAPPELAR